MTTPQPVIVSVPGEARYMVVEPYSYAGVFIDIGFMFDGASIPAIAWQVLYTPFHPDVMAAAVVHDKLYRTGERPRRQADKLFKEMLIMNGVDEVIAKLMYRGVRVGGRSAFNNNEEAA